MAIRCLIVEDEPPAQRILEKYISEISYLKLAGKASHPSEAMGLLKSREVELMFLDINLPRLSGLDFLKSMDRPPEIIITTAYPEYALEGFELNVRDYLVKPISFERFLKAVSRLPGSKAKSSQEDKTREEKEVNKETDFTFIKTDGSLYRVDFEKIRYIASDRDYVNIYLEDEHYFLRQSLKEWQQMLPEAHFFRVHKSYIVNLARIDEIFGNRIKIENEEIPIGRNYKDAFLDRIDQYR